MKRIMILALAFSFTIVKAEEKILNGQVVRVLDGNSLEIKTSDDVVTKIILLGVDCPEAGQPYYDEAMRCLEKMLMNKDVTVELKGKDRKGNFIGVVTTTKNLDPRIALLQSGLAWTSESNPIPNLEQHKQGAQEKKKGLWKESEPTAPWIYRRQQSMLQAKSS